MVVLMTSIGDIDYEISIFISKENIPSDSSCGYVVPEDNDIDQILFQILTKIIIVLNLKYLYHLQDISQRIMPRYLYICVTIGIFLS